MSYNTGYEQDQFKHDQPPPNVPGYGTTPQNMVIMQQPAPMQGGYRGPKRPWNSGLFGCFDDWKTCCLAYWCAPCLTCHLSSEMEEGCCMPWCVGIPGAIMSLRLKLRTERHIEGTILDDCCMTTFCTLCALCQLRREHNFNA